MSTIVTRSGKGSPLTNTEVDSNFSNLNTDKAELSGAVFTGAITTNSTIDGRDVATDGTKLDGIEASADVTDATNVTAAGALMDSELTSIASVKALNQGVATGDSPTFAALTSTGILEASDGTNGEMQFGLGTSLTTGAGTYDSTVRWNGSSGNLLFSQGAVEKMRIGNAGISVTGTATMDGLTTDDDVSGTSTLGRYSSGFAYSLVRPSATATGIEIRTHAGNALAHFLNDGTTKLHHNNAVKLATTSTGIDFTGTATMDGLVVDGNIGVGATPATWYSTVNAVQISDRAALWGLSGQGNTLLTTNAYLNSSAVYTYTTTDTAVNYQQTSGRHVFSTADSGTAGTAVTFRNQLRLDANGDISFYDDSGNAKFFWDASAESLGIGTTSAAGRLTISSDASTANQYINLVSTQSGSARSYSLGINSGAFRLFDLTANQTRMTIDSSGNVLINRSGASGLGKLNVEGGADFTGGDVYLCRDSGNVLVGNTDTTLYNNTVANTGGGNFIKDSQGTRLDVSRDNTSLVLNRPTTEGDFATFYKGASSVGSIGVTGTNDLYIASTTASHTGLRLGEGYYIPTNNAGATADNAVDIGLASIRYKDLYLSGGVYLGGTGAANKLDDYEEGTWTPVTGPTSTTATYAFRSGYYTKVGNLVTCYFGLKHNGGVWTGGEATISGLPFTVDTTGSYQEPQFIVTSVGLLPTGKGGSAAGGAFNTGEVSFYCSGTQGRGRSYVSNGDTVLVGTSIFATNSFIKATIIYHSS